MADKIDIDEKKRIIEAALFIAARPMSLAELYEILQIPKPEIKKIMGSMESHYSDHGVRLVERDGLYELQIKDEYVKHVEHLAPDRDFSRATMQTLSLIAYKSPMKQSDVIEIRGNRAYDHVKELLSKGFIRSEPKGHTNILHVTKKFLEYFNISSEAELKTYFSREATGEASEKSDASAPKETQQLLPKQTDVAQAAPEDIAAVPAEEPEPMLQAPEPAIVSTGAQISEESVELSKNQPAEAQNDEPAVISLPLDSGSGSASNSESDSEKKSKTKRASKKKSVSAVESPYKSQFSDVIPDKNAPTGN